MAQLSFKGKTFVQNYHLGVKYHELVPKKDKSVTGKISLHDNLILHGDNLLALKALLPTYAGKIKCIYIDPPYNTGNERWAYNDSVNSPMMQEWLGKVVDREDLTRHDKWLCMMTPRLKLLRELLRDDGVIFISIDDNENHHLKMLLDDIFGENNFLSTFVWKKRSGANDAKDLMSVDHEYILTYRRTDQFKFKGVQKDFAAYTNPDNDPLGSWTSGDLTCNKTAQERRNLFYDIKDPKTGIVYKCNPLRVWRTIETRMLQLIKDGKVIFPKNSKGTPQYKRHLSEVRSEFKPLSTWIAESTVSEEEIIDEQEEYGVSIIQAELNQRATKELREIFTDEKIFDYPKPRALIQELVKQSTEEEDVVLDSFSGSGTTAHAVLALNKEDGGNRKFILVECEEYADKITAERVRRVIKGVPDAKDENLKKGLGGTFSYFEIGKPIEMESILSGKNLPTYKELARYVFYTATGEEFDEKAVNEKKHFIGESKDYEVYLIYKPALDYLKNTALTLDRAKSLGAYRGKKRLVFAPTKYLDQDYLDELRIVFAQLPFEIYKLAV